MPPGDLPRSYEVVPQWRPVHTPHRIRLSLVQNSFRAMASLNPMIQPRPFVYNGSLAQLLSPKSSGMHWTFQCTSKVFFFFKVQPGVGRTMPKCCCAYSTAWRLSQIKSMQVYDQSDLAVWWHQQNSRKDALQVLWLGVQGQMQGQFFVDRKVMSEPSITNQSETKKKVCKAGSNHSAALWLWGANVWSKPGLQESNVTRKYVGELIDISYLDNLMYIELLKAIQGDLPCLLYLPNLDSHLLWGSLSLRSP